MKKYLFNLVKFLLWILIPLVYTVWVVIGLINYISESSGLLTIQLTHKARFDKRLVNQQIVKDIQINGEIVAHQNGLGTLSLRFYNFDRINNDKLMFRIREKGEEEWYYESLTNVDQFLPDKFFPFGFPVIKNSNGKIYEFEIESTQGARGDAIAISRFTPQIATRYQFDKSDVKQDLGLLGYVLAVKLLNLMTDNQFLYYLVSYVFPYVFYYVILFYLSEVYFSSVTSKASLSAINKLKPWLLTMSLMLILVDISIVKEFNDMLLLILFLLWLLMMLLFKLEQELLVYLGIICMLVYPLLYIFQQQLAAEKTAIWGYLFIFVYVVLKFFKDNKLLNSKKWVGAVKQKWVKYVK